MRIACVGLLASISCGRIGFDPLAQADAARAPGVPWELIQTAGQQGANTLAITPSLPRDLLLVAVNDNMGDSVTKVTDGVDPTFVPIPSARVARSGGGVIEFWYTANGAGGASSISVTEMSGNTPNAAFMWEVSNIRTTSPFDAAAVVSSGSAASSLVISGPQLVTSVPGELVVSVALAQNSVTSIDPGNEFTNDSTQFGDGWAHITSDLAPAGPHAAAWDVNATGTDAASIVSFFPSP